MVRPKPGRALNRDLIMSTVCLLNLVENSALGKMGFVRLLPATEDFVNGEEFQLGELGGIFLSHGFEPRTVVMPGGDGLAFRRVEILQVGLGHRFCAASLGYFVHDR